MNNAPTVHRWTTKSEYFDIKNGEEITKQNAKLNYNILKTHKNVKIENFTGKITYTHECERKRQLKLW